MAREMRLANIAYPSRAGKSPDEFMEEVEGFCRTVGKEVLSLTKEVEELGDKFAKVKDKVDRIKTGLH